MSGKYQKRMSRQVKHVAKANAKGIADAVVERFKAEARAELVPLVDRLTHAIQTRDPLQIERAGVRLDAAVWPLRTDEQREAILAMRALNPPHAVSTELAPVERAAAERVDRTGPAIEQPALEAKPIIPLTEGERRAILDACREVGAGR